MKKHILILMVGLGFMLFALLSSCNKSNEDLIKDYEKICTEMATAVKNHDHAKVLSLQEKGGKLEEELNKRELSEEEIMKVKKLQTQLVLEMNSER